MLIIKITYQDTTRRLAIDDVLSFDTLKKFCQDMFQNLKEERMTLTYIDNENDVISICSDLELAEAIRQLGHSDPKVLRIFIGNPDLKSKNHCQQAVNDKNSHFFGDDINDMFDKPRENQKVEGSNVEDSTIFESIEEKLQSAAKVVACFVDSLEIETKFKDVVESVGQNLKQASSSLDEKILEPLSKFAKIKVHELREEIDKLGAELKKIQSQLKDDLAKVSNLGRCVRLDQEAVREPTNVCAPSEDLLKLEEMGFLDRQKNLELLEKHPNDLGGVIDDLLG